MLPIALPSHKVNSEHLHRTCSTVKQVAALLLRLTRCRHLADKHVANEALDVAADARGSFAYVCVCLCSEVVGMSGERVDKIARNFRKYSRVYYEPPAEILYHSVP